MDHKSTSVKKYGNLVLAGLVVIILVLMIIPLPTFILDLLLTLNIALSITLLLVSLYVTEPLKIATFPSLLLLATMFRLGLNVASTRLILLQADAGTVIQSFGNFVVSGNIIVGFIVFFILTLIQFIVVAKGSERVAEVAARFTLDAMPGKQMAIDAELRSGHITYDEAKKHRTDLQRESQLYGAMDGAMKFVKGDAIAGLVITLINIIAGLGVGMLQMGMSSGEALNTYSILTVGDGLVSQIPSLLISLSSGFIITRVASETAGTDLGQEMSDQIMAQPRAIFIVGLLLIFMGLVPGLPTIPFLILGSVAAFYGYKFTKRQKNLEERKNKEKSGISISPQDNITKTDGLPSPLIQPVILELSTNLSHLIEDNEEGFYFKEELIGDIRSKLFWEFGTPLPPSKFRINYGLKDNHYRILINEIYEGKGEILEDKTAVSLDSQRLKELDIEYSRVNFSLKHLNFYWITSDDSSKVYDENIEILEPQNLISKHLYEVVKENLFSLLTMDGVSILLKALEKSEPYLVEECFPTPVTLPLLTQILKRLVEEKVSVRPLGVILSSLNNWVKKEKDPVVLTEYVRMELKKEISGKLSSDGFLPVYLTSTNVEEEVSVGIQRNDNGSFLSIDPDITMEIQENCRKMYDDRNDKNLKMVILCSMEIRRYLRQLLVIEIPDIEVISFQELDAKIQIQPLGEL
jgi:type III secretion protein V